MVASSSFVLLAVAIFAIGVNSQQGGQGGPEQPPSFLQGAPPEVLEDFKKVLHQGGSKTDKEIDDSVEAWIGKQSPSIKEKYAAFKEQMNGMRQKAEEAHKAAVAKFSPEAKVADQKIIEITSSSSLTAQQKHQQLDTLMNSLSPAVKDEIMKAMQGPQ